MSEFDRAKWDRKYGDSPSDWQSPSGVVTSLSSYLPESGRALDVAGGAGRHAIWLADHGLDVTIVDISSVGLSQAREESRRRNVRIRTREVDLEEQAFPVGPWDVILSHHFLWRPLFNVFPRMLTRGGRLLIVQPTVVNLERHSKPPRPYLLEAGELRSLTSNLTLIHYEEGWLCEGRHEAVLVAEK